MCVLPMMMAPAIAGLVWYYLFNSTFGWYHWLFQSLGINNPRWNPARIEDVTPEMVAAFFQSPWSAQDHPLSDLA